VKGSLFGTVAAGSGHGGWQRTAETETRGDRGRDEPLRNAEHPEGPEVLLTHALSHDGERVSKQACGEIRHHGSGPERVGIQRRDA
jgi:hypothetical protein